MGTAVIRELGEGEAMQLANVLCRDGGLRRELGVPENDRPTGEGFLWKVEDWCRQHRATTFAIVVDGVAVGTISLSQVSEDRRSARIGYWVATEYRGKGYAGAAFAEVLRLAASRGIQKVAARIEAGNRPSLRMWRRHGAKEAAQEDRVQVEIELGQLAG